MKCPNCGSITKEKHMFLHHELCEKCGYEEKDIYVINDGVKK